MSVFRILSPNNVEYQNVSRYLGDHPIEYIAVFKIDAARVAMQEEVAALEREGVEPKIIQLSHPSSEAQIQDLTRNPVLAITPETPWVFTSEIAAGHPAESRENGCFSILCDVLVNEYQPGETRAIWSIDHARHVSPSYAVHFRNPRRQ
nr:hypothetical protein [Sicyoidochytrium minutum DNA virus]